MCCWTSGPRPLAKLTDFGIARSTGDARLTGAGLTIGTAQYLSPEQALGGSVGPASDVYSLGLLLLECRTGRPAFLGSPIESALARLHRDPEIPDSLGPVLVPLLSAMTAREPQDRPTAAEVALSVAELAGGTAELPIAATWLADAGTTALLPPAAERLRRPRLRPPAAPAVPDGDGWLEPPHRRSTPLAAVAGTVLIGAVLIGAVLVGAVVLAIGLRGPGPHGGSPLPHAQPSTSATSSSSPTEKPATTAPVRLTSSAHPTPSSSHPVQVIATKPAAPKPKKSRPRKHGH